MRDATHFTDPDRMRQQYGNSERLRIRKYTHEQFSERQVAFYDWIIDQLDVMPGHLVADIGCGPGDYLGPLASRGARTVGADLSRGMAIEAHALGFSTVVADAQSLPFADATFDRAMCNHVLYHVPDQQLALREIRRITRSGGRVLLTTNGADHLRVFYDLAKAAAADIGYELPRRDPSPFTLEDVARVRLVFPDADVRRIENCLVFPDPQPALDYLDSWIGDTGPLKQAMRRRIEESIARDGPFRIPTVAGCFVATVA
jgi:SAM-dependent methyltransferase